MSNLNINKKLILLGTIALVVFLVLYYFISQSYSKRLEELITKKIENTKAAMLELEQRDTAMLASTLTVIQNDPMYAELLTNGSKNELYEYTLALHKKLKEEFGITHFYFHKPSGINYLRMHARELSGDRIERDTFSETVTTGKLSSGIEVGKTAMALRVVGPLYKKGEIVGYIELALEINHFLDILKKSTGYEFALYAEKDLLDKESWEELRSRHKGASGWDDMEEHVMIANTALSDAHTSCFSEQSLTYVEKDEAVKRLNDYNNNNGLACGGFPIDDVNDEGEHLGAVLTLIDITGEAALVARSHQILYVLLFLAFFVMFIGLWVLKHSIANPVEEIVDAANKMAGGNFSHRIKIRTRDEMGMVAASLNEMASQLDTFYQEMEELVKKKTSDLVEVNASLEDKNEELKSAFDKLELKTQEVERANEDLKGLERLKTEFLQTVSHELRSPLTPILGYLELMRDGDLGDFSNQQKECIQEMFICGKNLQMVLDELLEAASIQTGRLFVDLKEIKIRSILDGSIRNISRFANEHNIEIMLGPVPEGLVVIGDAKKLSQVITHLLRNAVKFNHDNGRIELTVEDQDSGIEIKISDNGIGIPRERLSRIFEAFYQVDSSSGRYYEGIGLGLYLVKKLIDAHSGRISVKSKANEGTTFTINLPKSRNFSV